MRTQLVNARRFSQSSLRTQDAPAAVPHSGGIISEIVYSDDQPILAPLLLPLLQQLGMQSRWLLWLAPQQKLSRTWLQQAGLPLDKMIELHHIDPAGTLEAMEKALRTGNYSAVLCWLPTELQNEEKMRLREAAESGNTYGFIMRPERKVINGPFSTLKIHSRLYH